MKAASDICCTSANAVKVVESLGAPRVIMIPDEYLAKNVAAQTKVEIIAWRGRCEVHERFTAADIRELREAHPDAVVLAHPECPPEVVAEADFAGSTAEMIGYVDARSVRRGSRCVTECSMSDNVAVNYPDVEFVRPCNLCPHMKRITLAKIRHALETIEGEVTIDPAIAAPARRAVETDARAMSAEILSLRGRVVIVGAGDRRPDDGAASSRRARSSCCPRRRSAPRARPSGRRAASPPRWARATARPCTPPTRSPPATASATPRSSTIHPRRARRDREARAARRRASIARDDGGFALGLEAAHRRARIVHAGGDGAGRELMRALIAAARGDAFDRHPRRLRGAPA